MLIFKREVRSHIEVQLSMFFMSPEEDSRNIKKFKNRIDFINKKCFSICTFIRSLLRNVHESLIFKNQILY